MKIKTVLITASVLAVLGAGGYFGTKKAIEANRKSVEVYPVSSINMGFFGDESTISGNVLSRDTQSVQLSTDYNLVKVYVKAGDTVKIGDPLLEYDMTLEELKREMEDLHHQTLELSLEAQERDLDKMMNNPGAFMANATLEREEDDVTASPDDELLMEEETNLQIPDFAGDVSIDSDIADEDMMLVMDDDSLIIDIPEIEDETDWEDPDDLPDEPVEIPDEEQADEDLVLDDNEDADAEDEPLESVTEADELTDDEMTVYDEEETEQDQMWISDPDLEYDEQLLDRMERLLLMESLLRKDYGSDPASMSRELITEALALYRERMAATPSLKKGTIAELEKDIWGKKRQISYYQLSEQTIMTLMLMDMDTSDGEDAFNGKDAVISIYRAYANLCFYDLVSRMETLKTAMKGKNPADLERADVLKLQKQIEKAVDAWYQFSAEWDYISAVLQDPDLGVSAEVIALLTDHYQTVLKTYAGENLKLEDPAEGLLSVLVDRLKKLMKDEEPDTESGLFEEEETEYLTERDDGLEDEWEDDQDYEGEEPAYTQEELVSMIREQKLQIRETRLQIRESDLKLKAADRKLDGKIVKATMNGVVKVAGTVDEGSADDGFIVISGAAGMYAEGTVNELSRDTIHVGDMLTGTSYENGASFTAKVTEISEYPASGDDDGFSYGFGYSSENSNASYYPFLAYIEDADDVTEGSAELQFVKRQSSAGIYLENVYIRTDENGKSYVFIQGADGLLKKQYVKTGVSVYGSGWEILSGLREDDKIAFPYGKNVYEGASTVEVESPYGGSYF